MSKCISRHGEYSEHTFTHNPECDYCGELPASRFEAMRSALVAIQELHKPAKGWISEREYLLYCADCGDATYPCKTRKLAYEGLGGGQDG